MTINRNEFSERELELLSENGIYILTNHDYSEDEVNCIDDKIEDLLIEKGFDRNGKPTDVCDEWEDLFDKFRRVAHVQLS